MPAELRDLDRHFLASIYELLGEEYRDIKTDEEFQRSIFIGKREDLLNLLKSVVPNQDELRLDFHQFRTLMIFANEADVSRVFFDAFFGKCKTLKDFDNSVANFRILAMRLYGNFKFAFNRLSINDGEGELRIALEQTHERSEDEFKARVEFTEIKEIPKEDLFLLGYVSGHTSVLLGLALRSCRS